MRFKDILKMRKLLIVWLLSYLFILLISITVIYGIHFESVRIIEQEISRANSSMLAHARHAMDSRMRDVERLTMQIALNSRILNALRVDGYFRPEDQFNLYKAIEDLRHYVVSSDFVTDLYVYLHDTGTVITPNTHIGGRLFFNLKYGSGVLRYEEWKSTLLSSHRRNYLIFQGQDSSENPRNFIVSVQSIPIDSIRNPRGTIVISINIAKFRDVIEDIGWVDEGTVFIINTRNEIVAASDDYKAVDFVDNFNYQLLDATSESNGITYHMIDGEKTVVAFSKSEIADWKYISVIPYSVFWEKAGYIRFLAWVGVFLTLFFGGACSYLFARKNYSPIDKIIKNMTGKAKIGQSSSLNEYHFIQANITSMIDENEKISKRLEEQNRTLKDNFLLKLLKGKLDENVVSTQTFTTFGINFHTNNFAIALFKIEGFRELAGTKKTFDITNNKHAKFIIVSLVDEFVKKGSNIIALDELEEDEGMIACIFNFKNTENETNTSNMLNIILDVKEFIYNNFDFTFSVSLSDIHQGLQNITRAYNEAFEAMEFRFIAGIEDIVSFKDIKKSRCTDYHYTIESEQRLINFIKIGDFEKTSEVLLEVLSNNFSNEAFSHEMAKCLMFDLVSTIMKTADNLSDASFLEELQPIKSLSDCKTVMEMKYRLADIMKKVCNYHEANKSGKNALLSCSVKNFIALKYSDVNLGVSMIGDKFGLTPSYLSKLFKEQTNESLPDYITKVRIEMAMRLLKDDHATIFDVAQKVGYCNSNVFIRAFKKYQGITPGRFKEMKESS